MALTYSAFIEFFPEFSPDTTQGIFENNLETVLAITNGYPALTEGRQRDYAVACHLAMLLETKAAAARGQSGGSVLQEKTRDDEIRYAPVKDDSLTGDNKYGKILKSILRTSYSVRY